jgi:hypothetical protein
MHVPLDVDLKKDEEAFEIERIDAIVEESLSAEEDRRILRKIDMKYSAPVAYPTSSNEY